jgi:hypothetical protein
LVIDFGEPEPLARDVTFLPIVGSHVGRALVSRSASLQIQISAFSGPALVLSNDVLGANITCPPMGTFNSSLTSQLNKKTIVNVRAADSRTKADAKRQI